MPGRIRDGEPARAPSATVVSVSSSSVADIRTIAYRVDGEDRIVSVDENWGRFAEANGWSAADEVIGTSLWDSIGGSETSLIWSELLARVRHGVALAVPFRCDSPGERRHLRLSLALAEDDAVTFCSTTLGHSERDPIALVAANYGEGEAVRCCSWCKRFDARGWVEVEEAVCRLGLLERESRPVTHAMCADCEVAVRLAAGL